MSTTENRPALAAEVKEAQKAASEAGIVQLDFVKAPADDVRAANLRFQHFLNEGAPDVAVEETVVDTVEPPVPLRIYRPEGAGPFPVYVHIHGGGFAQGTLETLDRVKREIVAGANVAVVGLEYALAPEHPYPTSPRQVAAVADWLEREGAAHGLDARRMVIGGDSAGAHLALGLLLSDRDRGARRFQSAALVYPMLSDRHDTPSHRDFGDGSYGLSTARLSWFWSRYLPDDATRRQVLDGLAAADLSGLPPVLLLAAALDPLLDDTLSLEQRLVAAGNPVELTIYEAMPHGFLNQTRLLSGAREARDRIVGLVKKTFG